MNIDLLKMNGGGKFLEKTGHVAEKMNINSLNTQLNKRLVL